MSFKGIKFKSLINLLLSINPKALEEVIGEKTPIFSLSFME